MGNLAVGTIVAKNYLSFARVLANSFREHHPEIPLFVLLADEVDDFFDPGEEPFRLLGLDELDIPQLPLFRFRYSLQQVVTAAKPYLLSALLNRGYENVIFLDADILVLDKLSPLWRYLAERSILLTPHLLAPPRGEDRTRRELNILRSGISNGGFVGVSDSSTTRDFLEWWQNRLYRHCYYSIEDGAVYDQRWLDLVPSLFEDFLYLREPGVNLGYWDLPHLRISFSKDGGIEVDRRPCLFFHFSGFDPDQPRAVTRYSSDLNMGNVGPASALFRRYLELLQSAGYHETKNWPYAYGRFDNGVPVPDVARQICWDLGDRAAEFGDPLQAATERSFFSWLQEPADEHAGVSRLWQAVYDRRPDVQKAYADLDGPDREAFLAWAAERGIKEHCIDERFATEPQ